MTTNGGPGAAGSGGPWEAGKGEGNRLASLADLVRFVYDRDGGLWSEAAAVVLDGLQQRLSGLELFERSRVDAYAQPVDDEHVWREASAGHASGVVLKSPGWSATNWGGKPSRSREWQAARPPIARAAGQAGALLLARESWVEKPHALPAALDHPPCSRFAIRASLAAELFGMGRAAEVVSLAAVKPVDLSRRALAAVSRVVQPEGGAWPHGFGTKWTDEERGAMRAMRLAGMSDDEIAETAGCVRQRVGQLIGSSVANRADHALDLAAARQGV